MGELSVFIDESGDSGANSRLYIVTLVLHDQSRPVDNAVARLGSHLGNLGFPLDAAIHTGPIIRREEMFSNMDVPERKKIFTALFRFAMGAGVKYATFAYRKSELGARDDGEIAPLLQERIARDVKLFLDGRLGYFTSFDKVIVYYDNGQRVVGAGIREAFEEKLFGVDFRLIMPSDYRLSQVADMATTLELLRRKDDRKELSRSELEFFGSPGRLRRNYLRHIEKLRLK